MSTEDSGVIDLFAVNARARASAAPPEAAVRDVFSSPVPAVSTDIAGVAGADADGADGELDGLDNPFARKPRSKLKLVAGLAALLLLVAGISAASVGGSSAPQTKASAAGRPEPAPVLASASPSPLAVTAQAPSAKPAAPIAPPSASAAVVASLPPRAGARPLPQAKTRSPLAAGPKLTKVQSAGIVSP